MVPTYVTSQYDEECHHFIIKYHCHKKCHNVNNNVIGNYKTYWCADKNGSHSGYMFGGLYSSVAVNSLTKARSCPSHYYPLRFGEDTHICVSDDDELGGSVPFGGFESCSAGNILSTKSSSGELRMSFGKLEVDPNSWPHRYPTGYIQYVASME